MSTPTRPHHLAREQAQGAGGTYVAARHAQMHCDGAMGGCAIPPERAPVLMVPAKHGIAALTRALDGMSPKRQAAAAVAMQAAPAPIRQFTTLHYCRRHQQEARFDLLLSDDVKRQIEVLARSKWSHEFRPDFEGAFIDWVLVTTPEYRRFLLAIERRSGATFHGLVLL